MKLDASRSRVTIHTFAEGLFSALAHDLEIDARDLDGERAVAVDGAPASAEVHVPVSSLRVVGAVKRGKVDAGALSASDRQSIERQIQGEVFRGGAEVIARGTLEGGRRAKITITAPTGRAEVACDVDVVRGADGAPPASARGAFDLSLRSLGVAPVKGPLGAFKLSDRVRITFDLTFAGA
jgi:hypothetical protein